MMSLEDILDRDYSPPPPDYTDEEKRYRAKIIRRMESMRDQREADQAEFDEMGYSTYYDTNARAANSYIPPKTNPDDTRIVTGTTHEKEITLLSAILNYNLEPNVVAFDKSDLAIDGLGKVVEDMVKKSREIEDYDGKRPLIYKEMLDQGDVFVEEAWTEHFSVEKGKADWEKAKRMEGRKIIGKLKKLYGRCEARLLQGKMVYLGNIRQFDEREQPDIAIVSTIPYEDAAALFADWERFANVPRKVVKAAPDATGDTYGDWTLLESQEDMVEVVKYQSKFSNEFMIMLNGVMMLPIGFPLRSISPSGEYTVAKGSTEPISGHYAYSKSIPAKTKVDQATADEMLKLIILKTQQSFKPPMANNTKRTLSKRIWSPGTMHNDIDVSKLQPIVTPTGVTPAEFSAWQLIKKVIDEKTSAPVFSGDASQGSQTATEIMELKKQSMMKLGLAIWGVVQLEKKLTWLRIQNIIAHWTEPVDERVTDVQKGLKESVYRTVAVDTTLENGQRGRRIVQFSPEMANNLTADQVAAEEQFISNETGVMTRKTYLHPEEFQRIKATWYVTITPTEKDSSQLERVLFTQNVRDAAAIFGPQSLNMDHLKERFAILAKEDPRRFFVQGQVQAMGPEMAQQAVPGGGNVASQIMAPVRQQPQTPSLNTLARAS